MTEGGLRQERVAGNRLLLQFDADTACMEAARSALTAFLEGRKISARALYHTELAFEELVTNAIRHGGAGSDPRAQPIDASVYVLGEEIRLTVEDDCPPFNPLEAPHPALPTSLDEARIGGLGLMLVRKSSERMEYERTATGRNRVTVVIACNAAHESS